ncbi:5-formyltetrahydrofolate cyclo-ligase [Ketogulonicigenium robustum]|uniref:5-formyltetrahydrofolate cyclo-ligase n=2 Tax=Ketogulonicigenium robustum TaxID=92947 RepID=A0A1W6P1G6_9RHOB|nr:5-formyltetrahydrofolate cyclo-ligase [Ketogulonicigenium robustum]
MKAAARAAAAQRRADAHAAAPADAAAHLQSVLADFAGQTISGYVPIRTEIDLMPALLAAHGAGSTICLPVIDAPATPLRFRAWQPGGALAAGALNTQEPAEGAFVRPDVVVLPLLAFATDGRRLGYGGGFYDRTLHALRAAGPVIAIGFAYDAQLDEDLPIDPNDQPLDLIVTETRIIDLRG